MIDPYVNRHDLKEAVEWARTRLEEADNPDLAPDGLILYGQEIIKAMIAPFLRAPAFPHSLILGPPGSGKSHLGRWIASKRREPFTHLYAPIKLEVIPETGIMLIDEVHRQTKPEWLFPLMERQLSFLAATTRQEMIEPAFASRFALHLTLEPLDQEATEELLVAKLGEGPEISILASASVGNPRTASQIADTAIALNTRDPELILSTVRINGDGLRDHHINYLKTLKRIGKPMGVDQLALLLNTGNLMVKEWERLLLSTGLVDLTTSGRILTIKGHRYLELLNA